MTIETPKSDLHRLRLRGSVAFPRTDCQNLDSRPRAIRQKPVRGIATRALSLENHGPSTRSPMVQRLLTPALYAFGIAWRVAPRASLSYAAVVHRSPR